MADLKWIVGDERPAAGVEVVVICVAPNAGVALAQFDGKAFFAGNSRDGFNIPVKVTAWLALPPLPVEGKAAAPGAPPVK